MKATKKIATIIFVASLLAQPAQAANYQVQSGDSLYKIAQKYNVTVQEIKDANNMSADVIYQNQYLYIPDKKQTDSITHTVVKGDTLSALAKKYKIEINRLKAANGLDSDMIYIGQQLLIPKADANLSSRGEDLTLTNSQIELMARIVYGESRGEPFEGQVAVAAVVLNRLFSDEFPSTIEGVIYQNLAFTAVADGQYNLTPNAQAYQAVRIALEGYDPTYGATYYWNPATATSQWVWSREITLKIGKHVFAH